MASVSQRKSRSAEQPVICPRCGLTNPVASHFCGGCGKALDQIVSVMPEAERRHICVLFCDLVGSTPLSYRLDAEELRDVVGSFQVHATPLCCGMMGSLRNVRATTLWSISATLRPMRMTRRARFTAPLRCWRPSDSSVT